MKNAPRSLEHHLQEIAQNYIEAIEHDSNGLCIVCKGEQLIEMCHLLRDDRDCQFGMLIDIAGVDYLSSKPRFQVVYQLLSLTYNQRIKLKVNVDSNDSIPSVVDLWPCAGWYEREAWDMYGIFFSGNTDLRRILTDYGFDGHPQRKDFPLSGYVELRYDESKKRVAYSPVQLPQAFRDFDFVSPWEHIGVADKGKHLLPGDEKAEQQNLDDKAE